MTYSKLIIKSFTHYLKANLLVACGVAISTAVLTGALIIGDSIKFSLEQSTFYRLGNTTHVVSTVDRYFRSDLAGELALKGGFDVAPAMLLEGIAVADGGAERVNNVQISGIDHQFEKMASTPIYTNIKKNEVVINANLAEKLQLKIGDSFLVRIKKASLIPLNAPFISDAETSVSFNAVVKEIANQYTMGFFNLKNSQTTPYNLFLSLSELNELMKFDGKANRLLISASSYTSQQIQNLLDDCFTPEDAGLKTKDIPLTNEKEIASERVFIEDRLIKAFEPFRNSHPVLTYFANSIAFNGKSTPYSFISTIEDNSLKNNDIVINEWVAADLNVKRGDSLIVKYYEIGPLRQLVEKGTKFVIKEIVPIKGQYADKDLMPNLPGMSDAGNCREWEAGIPISLGAIRDKDEAYWKLFRGTPKAFISLKSAHQLWENRYGNSTAIRVNNNSFSDKAYRALFRAAIKPENLGVMVTAVRENGLSAARNGVDFSQLFLGLSFFLLIAALILTALLFLMNLENRQLELGTLRIMGFTRNQIRQFFLGEGAVTALAGTTFGLLFAVIYTKIIFMALNSLWWEVVRTSVLEIKITIPTLITGMVISFLISFSTILLSVNRSLKRQVIELQQNHVQPQRPLPATIKKMVMLASMIVAVGLVGYQLILTDQPSPSLFFLSGGLLLIGILLLIDIRLRRNSQFMNVNFSIGHLIRLNRSQNLNRSMTVTILFALGTFLVVSTGANRQDLLSDSSDKNSGTGGFQYFAETSVPVLFSLNDKERLLKEGIKSQFTAVQFSKMDGDDASCLNLNRVSNPAILGADPMLLKERFNFAAKCPEIQDKSAWEALDDQLENGVVPAIADQTVIQWGLGLNIGDTLKYRNERGDTLRLKLIAGLAPSVFQGFVLISNANYLKHFPTVNGSNIFLIDVPKGMEKETGEELNTVFRDYGWEMIPAVQRLIAFNSVTNTYLSIFLALGALGLILGTVGLGVVLARSILERKKEIALMQSIGFTNHQIVALLIREYAVLLLWGMLIGFVAAVVAVLPNFLRPGNDISFFTVLLIVAAILANGMTWIFLLSWLGLRGKRLISNLNI
jgi:ABC-type lipoprotein release transport system permease subunit